VSRKPQTCANHAHHPRLWTAGLLGWLVAVFAYGGTWFFGRSWRTAAEMGLLLAVTSALLIGRVYVTALQDRIIRAEMRARCGALLPPAGMALFGELTMKQIVALRFASDAELPALLERAARERLAPDTIKRAVRDWVPDYDRT